MKTTLLFALLTFSLVTARAQTKMPYEPGKWYVGVRWAAPSLPNRYTVHYTGAVEVMGGYNFKRHLAVQVGIQPLKVASSVYNSEVVNNQTVYEQYFYPRQLALAIPVSLRYSFSKPYRRFQPYLLAGVNTLLALNQPGTFEKFTNVPNDQNSYDRVNLAQGEAPLINVSTVSIFAGMGLRLRIINRFSLTTELLVNPVLRKNDHFILSGHLVGLMYEFK